MAGWIIVCTLSACGWPQEKWAFHREMVAADRLADLPEGWAEAERRYAELGSRAYGDATRRHLSYRMAVLVERQGREDEALRLYARLYGMPTGLHDHEAADAYYRTSKIVRTRGGWSDADRMLRSIIAHMPNTHAAGDALFDLVDRWRETGTVVEGVRWLSGVYPTVRHSEIGDDVAYWTARLLDEDLDLPLEAVPLYQLVYSKWRRGGLWDDAWWREGLVWRRLGEREREYRTLQDFFATREAAIMLSDYNSKHYRTAVLRMAELHEEAGRIEEAIRMYRVFQGTFPLALDWDDVQYRVIELQLSVGDRSGARSSLESLRASHPESWHIGRAERLMEAAP